LAFSRGGLISFVQIWLVMFQIWTWRVSSPRYRRFFWGRWEFWA
jgi:hypothetical protein